MERRKVLRREVLATIMSGSLLPKYPFTDVILQTRTCGNPRNCFRDILQHTRTNLVQRWGRVLITHFHFPLSQEGHKLVPKYCRKSEDILKLLSKDTPPLKPKAGTLLLLGDTSNGTLQQPPLLQLQSSVFYWAASCLRPSCRSLGKMHITHD